jgi:small-conductance mechanosensitive channel
MHELLNIILKVNTAYAQGVGNVATETEEELTGILDFIIVKIPSFIGAFIVFVIFFFIAKAIKSIVENRMAERFEEHKEVQILAARTASTTTVIIGATIALNIAGIDLTVIIAAAGFGIGFALKDIIINFLAGVMILAQKQFTIGDFIKIDNTIGKITEIQARATILKALDGTRVVVPNSELFTKQVISYTSNPFRRIEIPVGVEYDTDLVYAVKMCYKALSMTTGVLVEPKPVVLVKEFSDSSINLLVRAWVESRGGWLSVKSDLTINIKKMFDKAGINIPFPIRTVVMDKDQEEEKEEREKKMHRMMEKMQEDSKKDELKEKPKWIGKQVEKQKSEPQSRESSKPETKPVKPKIETQPSKDQPGSAFITESKPSPQKNEEAKQSEQLKESK